MHSTLLPYLMNMHGFAQQQHTPLVEFIAQTQCWWLMLLMWPSGASPLQVKVNEVALQCQMSQICALISITITNRACESGFVLTIIKNNCILKQYYHLTKLVSNLSLPWRMCSGQLCIKACINRAGLDPGLTIGIGRLSCSLDRPAEELTIAERLQLSLCCIQ